LEEEDESLTWRWPALIELLKNEVEAGSNIIQVAISPDSIRTIGETSHDDVQSLIDRLNKIQARSDIRTASTKDRETHGGQGIFTTRSNARKFGGDLIYSDDGNGHLVATLTWKNI